jgi:hypothetical protein
LLVGMLCLVLALGACSSAVHRGVAASTTTTTSVDPDVVPAVITAAYVDAVFRVLNHINGEAVRALVAARAVTPEVKLYLRAIYNDPLYATEVKIAQQTLAQLSNFRHPPGDVDSQVVRVIHAARTCIFVSIAATFSAVVFHPGASAAADYWRLSPKQVGIDPKHLNPTPWALSFNATYPTPTVIPDQCAGS